MFIKKNVVVKLLKSKDVNKCVDQKKKVMVKPFKRKDSIEICPLKKRLLWNLLNVNIPSKYVY